MASLLKIEQRLYPGVYYTMKPVKGSFSFNIQLYVRWYGYITLWFISIWSIFKKKVIK